MNGRLLLAFALVGLAAIAGTKSYTVTLLETVTLGGTELQPGSYRLDIGDQKAVIHHGKLASEVPVKVETGDSKYATTTVRINTENGGHRVEEIRLGGTRTRLVLREGSSVGGGQ